MAESWYGTVPRAVLEAHFARGLLAVTARRPGMAREFDLAERVVPAAHRERLLTRDEAQIELLHQAARALGVGTAADLADYYRLPVRETRPLLSRMVENGRLRPVKVDGWHESAFVDSTAQLPGKLEAAALLSPFDPLVWFRPRTLRLFDFHYRMEVFIPQRLRRWGVYVLPFLMNERLTARVDVKADRSAGILRVLASYLETHADAETSAAALAAELRLLASWLGLHSVKVGRKGDFARALKEAVKAL